MTDYLEAKNAFSAETAISLEELNSNSIPHPTFYRFPTISNFITAPVVSLPEGKFYLSKSYLEFQRKYPFMIFLMAIGLVTILIALMMVILFILEQVGLLR